MQRDTNPNSYDQVPYPTYALPQTHPRRLETIAWLLSLSAPSSLNCRVLELGCGDGGNLIPMAVASPECQFVGVDASPVQINMGRERISVLQLDNIQLEDLSIEQIDETFGTFDYIICHGVFSWVPSNVQTAILRTIQELLTENGIAYVSYNTQPGWHARGAIRNMMAFHVDRFDGDTPAQRIGRGRQLLDFLTRATNKQQNSYGLMLRENLELLNQLPDAYLYHEHLEEYNQPIWFLDFCDLVSKFGLRYLGEADFSSMFAGLGFTDEDRMELDSLAPGLLEKEQYLDFLRNRSFRQTLICKSSLRPNYDIRASRIHDLYVGSAASPVNQQVDLTSGVEQSFALGNETTLNTESAIFKAALVVLRNTWPQLMPFAEVLQGASQQLKSAGIDAETGSYALELSKAILTTYSSTSQPLIELAKHPPQFTLKPSNNPLASPLARLQANSTSLASNLRHESVRLSEVQRFLLSHLDGNLTLAELNEVMERKRLESSSENGIENEPSLELSAEVQLSNMARLALLLS